MVTLPTNPKNLGPVDFPSTTFYHWPQFSKNLTEQRSKALTANNFTNVKGPVLFRDADSFQTSRQQVNLRKIIYVRFEEIL